MFLDQLKILEQESNKRLKIHWFFSREQVDNTTKGRIDKNTLQQLLKYFSRIKKFR